MSDVTLTSWYPSTANVITIFRNGGQAIPESRTNPRTLMDKPEAKDQYSHRANNTKDIAISVNIIIASTLLS
jgi:hypothetical protein